MKAGPLTGSGSRVALTAFVAAATLVALPAHSRSEEPDASAPRSVKNVKLKVSKNGRYFVDQDGKPFFYLGDTAWLIFQRLDNKEVEDYLKDRAAKGFTVLQAYVIRGLEKRHPDGPINLLGESPFVDRDPTKPNEAFFKHVDH